MVQAHSGVGLVAMLAAGTRGAVTVLAALREKFPIRKREKVVIGWRTHGSIIAPPRQERDNAAVGMTSGSMAGA